MSRPVLLDLFCGAGGAAIGYHRAGFDVVGVDINPQPNYPFEFHQRDAMGVLTEMVFNPSDMRVDAIHASPPCQAYSVTKSLHNVFYPELVEMVRFRLRQIGKPWVIENVVGAPLANPVVLCGSSFGLGVRRHRLFQMSDPPALIPPCNHHDQPEPIDVTGTGSRRTGLRTDGKGGNSRKPRNLAEAREAMGIGWMTRQELSEAIPPAYTEWIGHQLMAQVQGAAA